MANRENKESVFFSVNVFLKVLKRFLGLTALGLGLSALLGLGLGVGYFVGLVEDMPVPSQEEFAGTINNVEERSHLTDHQGEEIGTLRTDLVRTNVPLANISADVVNGLVATEDENFFHHNGVVPSAIIRAFVSQFASSGASSGGSTITQQLVKQRLLTNEVSMERKAKEILLSLRLEQFFSKEQILESYLNISPYGRNNKGENIAGIEEAAKGVFGVSADELSLAQAAYLVGMPQNPYAYTPYQQDGSLKSQAELQAGLERRKEVLNRMYLEGIISKSDYDQAMAYDVRQDFIETEESELEDEDDDERSSFLYQAIEREARQLLFDYLLSNANLEAANLSDEQYASYMEEADSMLRNNGLTIQSSIDLDIYNDMNANIENAYTSFGPTYTSSQNDPETGEEVEVVEPVQNGTVLIENATGRIIGFVGGVDFNISQVDHAFSSRRSPGSTFKPLLTYGPAIEEGLASPATPLADTYMKAKQADGTYWEPSNYGQNISHSFIPARQALANSLNNPTIYLYNELLNQGVDVQSYAQRLGLNNAIADDEFENIALSVGGTSTGPTVVELAGAYASLSNQGQYIQPYLIEAITDSNGHEIYRHQGQPVQAFSPDTAYIVGDMLRDVLTSGTWSRFNGQLDTSFDYFIKTGTSEDNRDLWVSGSTPSVTLTSWIGYDNLTQSRNLGDDAPSDVYGMPDSRHANYWIQLMNNLGAQYPDLMGANQMHQEPEGVHEETIVADTGTLPGSFEGPYGSSYTIPNSAEMTTDLFPADMSPREANFSYAIGGKLDELVEALEKYRNPGNGQTETQINRVRNNYQERRAENERARQNLGN
ncbi:transglycosylase domain-containing protein [Aerococcus kribbianus]|uniref:Transglycosylase domain-containing protein n=1 Tax=Aerococcus kribbianus TaxID=2999064 RepID=A0A9X3JD15_9LACT|nr:MULTISPECIES: transglycosylase domain-containing protein [unclassified Aerococcus]MCZ0717035.1 transglycosylase domain-containing protein [Aerococcus sp. YH-aer221]MCZ0725323.1 transglycosylase domain-containing protein [Aerococcus sp. YH-aer222]